MSELILFLTVYNSLNVMLIYIVYINKDFVIQDKDDNNKDKDEKKINDIEHKRVDNINENIKKNIYNVYKAVKKNENNMFGDKKKKKKNSNKFDDNLFNDILSKQKTQKKINEMQWRKYHQKQKKKHNKREKKDQNNNTRNKQRNNKYNNNVQNECKHHKKMNKHKKNKDKRYTQKNDNGVNSNKVKSKKNKKKINFNTNNNNKTKMNRRERENDDDKKEIHKEDRKSRRNRDKEGENGKSRRKSRDILNKETKERLENDAITGYSTSCFEYKEMMNTNIIYLRYNERFHLEVGTFKYTFIYKQEGSEYDYGESNRYLYYLGFDKWGTNKNIGIKVGWDTTILLQPIVSDTGDGKKREIADTWRIMVSRNGRKIIIMNQSGFKQDWICMGIDVDLDEGGQISHVRNTNNWAEKVTHVGKALKLINTDEISDDEEYGGGYFPQKLFDFPFYGYYINIPNTQ